MAHTLAKYVAIVSPDHKALAMTLVIPTLLSRAASEGNDTAICRETSARLLELAAADQIAFRGVVAGMSEAQRGYMEEVIRSGTQSENVERDVSGDSGQPTIALKMDFGI